jgi:putative transposase
MDAIDEQYTKTPFYGTRRMAVEMSKKFERPINRKKIRRLMKKLGLSAIYPKPNLSKGNKQHKKYPYLLKNLVLTSSNQAWSTDITYVRLKDGFAYLMAVIDWYSRKVIAWGISNTMDTDFCVSILKESLNHGKPSIFNTDQGSQFTSEKFTGVLEVNEIKISMDGKGRALDNVFVERLWRSVKYENIYLKGYENLREAKAGLTEYFEFYNTERPHQSLGYKYPEDVHMAKVG